MSKVSAKILRVMAVSLMLAAVGCKSTPKNIILQREWTANAEYAGDVWASLLASEKGMQLDVREGSELIDPVKLVRSGKAQFGVASADRVLRENEGGAGLVIIATATYRSPVVFLAQKKLGMSKPQDFIGHTVGLQAGTNTELIFKALINSQDIPLQKIKVVDSGWGTATFETGTIDVLGAFDYDEPVTLRIKGKDFDPIEPEQFGVRYVGTVYFTSKELVANSPGTVQDFMNNLIKGWRKALQNPDKAIEMLSHKYENVRNNHVKELKSLEKGRKYFSGENGRLLYASQERWEEMARSLIALGELKSFEFGSNVDYRFLDKALVQ